jgi:hypothetical protein
MSTRSRWLGLALAVPVAAFGFAVAGSAPSNHSVMRSTPSTNYQSPSTTYHDIDYSYRAPRRVVLTASTATDTTYHDI